MKINSIRGIIVLFAIVLMTGCNAGRKVVAVSGIGTVMAQPDTVQMSISLSNTAPTTSQAQQEVNNMVSQVIKILQDAGIEEKNISTASLRFYPEYEWGGPRRMLLGQKAEQVITFSAGITHNEDSGTNKVSAIIDQLIRINGIELQQMQFNVKDNTELLFARSRELAYHKAREKAEQYAKLSGMKIVKALTISEDGNNLQPVPSPASNRMIAKTSMEFAAADSAGSALSLPTGEMEITSQVFIEFLMK